MARLPLPVVRVPRVLGVEDFALKHRRRYATVLIDADTGERIDVLPGRGADAQERRLRKHRGLEIVCRDGSGAYGEAVRRALPDAVQVNDRRHLWKNLRETTLAEVRSHSARRATANPPRPAGVHEQTTRERRHQIHGLLGKGAALLECAHRLNAPQHRQALRAHPRIRGPAPHYGLALDRAAVDAGLTQAISAGQQRLITHRRRSQSWLALPGHLKALRKGNANPLLTCTYASQEGTRLRLWDFSGTFGPSQETAAPRS
jgi:hypothetical protein